MSKQTSSMISNRHVFSIWIMCVAGFFSISLQAQEVRIPVNPISLEDAFREVERQTDYLISYNIRDVRVRKKILFTSQRISVEQLLRQILDHAGYGSSIRGNHIVIFPQRKEVPGPKAGSGPEPVWRDQVSEVPVPQEELSVWEPEVPVQIGVESPQDRDWLNLFPEVKSPEAGKSDYGKEPARWAVRSNLLYGLGTLTPNGGVEAGLTERSTLLLSGGYNAWRKKEDRKENKKLWHWLASAEYRYWLDERLDGHFFGGHLFYSQYNISGKKMPLLLEKGSRDYRYQGSVVGAGISYGYQFVIGNHWNLELNAGIGVGFQKYDKWDCERCGEKIEENVKRTFVAPTKLGVTLLYLLP